MIMQNYNLTEEELKLVLNWFGSSTMTDILRLAYKQDIADTYEEEVNELGNTFPYYDLYQLSIKAKSPYVK